MQAPRYRIRGLRRVPLSHKAKKQKTNRLIRQTQELLQHTGKQHEPVFETR